MHTGEITVIYILHSTQILKRPKLMQDINEKKKKKKTMKPWVQFSKSYKWTWKLQT